MSKFHIAHSNTECLALQKLAQTHQSQARTMYTALRRKVVSTVYNSWRDTGVAWEHYNPETEASKGQQHFTGWTALVVNIASIPSSLSETTFIMGYSRGSFSIDMHTLISGDFLALFLYIFRRDLARIWTSMFR